MQMNLLNKGYTKTAIFVIAILHIVGVSGITWPYTRPLMILLTPANLIISALLLIFGHSQRGVGFWIFFILSFTIGYVVEVIGINTGLIFGNYSYGKALGFQLFGTPLLIGINWFILSYTTGHLSHQISKFWWLNAFIAATLMTAIDVIIEPVAIFLTYWQWEYSIIPLSNYIGWFFTSLIIQILFSRLQVRSKNGVSTPLLVIQVLFFLVLLIFISL